MMTKSDWIEPSLLRAFVAEGTTAHRVCTGNDGWAERFDRDLLISYKNNSAQQRMLRELEVWAETAGLEFDRVFSRFLPKGEEGRKTPQLLFGTPEMKLETIVTERNLRFGIDFAAGYSTGLFLDQRENRTYVRKAAPGRLLNCFAYTCSFSVAAACGGAQTVNVDLSKKSLSRGRDNFALNDLPTNKHRFIADDVRPVLRRLARRGEKFGMIILDPPTFARGSRGRAFRIQDDFEKVILDSLPLLESAGEILLSTNCAALSQADLDEIAKQCLGQMRFRGKLHHRPQPSDFPEGSGAATVWLTLR